MTNDRSHALVPEPSRSLSASSRLAERTLADRVARTETATVAGRTLLVGPGGYGTIGEAVALAEDGDSVIVRPGTYRESVRVAHAIKISGDGERGTIVVVSGVAPCFVLTGCAANLANLTLRGGGRVDDRTLAAISVNGGTPVLEGLVFDDSHGIVIEGADAAPIVRGNLLRGGLGVGIFVRWGAGGTVEGNEVVGNTYAGIMIAHDGSAPRVRSNRIHDSADNADAYGIYVCAGAGGTIEGNEIFGTAGAGIQVAFGGTDPIVRENKIHDGLAAGVAVKLGAGGTFENNDIYRNAEAGITIAGAGTSPTIRSNKVHDGQSSGIFAHTGSAGLVEANEIFGNAGSGVVLFSAGTAPLVRLNSVHDNGADGIRVFNGARGTIESNDVRHNTEAGVMIAGPGSAPAVRANRIYDGNQPGVMVAEGATGVVEGNEIFDNATGVAVADPGTDPVIRANTIRDSLYNGIIVFGGAAGLVENNRVSGAGVTIGGKGTSPLIRANTIMSTTGRGLEIVAGATPIVSGNVVS